MCAAMKMDSETYEVKRNALIGIIEGVMERSNDLPGKTRGELAEVVGKLKRNSFEIALVGEFQGGKSTTFDAICDGREISPRGVGVKTSACKISAQSIPEGEEEYADLAWKTDDELMLTMYDIVCDNLRDDKDGHALFPDKMPETLPSLSDARVREYAEKAIRSEWEKYSKNIVGYDREGNGKLDLLQISTLILKWYGTPELDELRARTRVVLEDIKSLVAFPHKWAIRWQKDRENTDWAFNEIPFVFLGEVNCYVHCKNLERLGCVITDCPGLFAGPWDTEVARKAMLKADAILYLIGGEKQMTAADMRVLSEICKRQQAHKLFFAINARLSKAHVEHNLRPTDFSMIKGKGIAVEREEEICVFNAALAFNAKTMPADPVAWGKTVRHALAQYLELDAFDENDAARVGELQRNPAEMYKASDLAGILAKIEMDIINKKFESILVTGGLDKARMALDALNGTLAAKEAAAKKKLEDVKADEQRAHERLSKFKAFVSSSVEEALYDRISADDVANDFWRAVYFDNIDAYSDEICDIIKRQLSSSRNLFKIIWEHCKNKFSDYEDNEELKGILSEPTESAMNKVCVDTAEGWMSKLADGQNGRFTSNYGKTLERIKKDAEREWKEKYAIGSDLLNGLAMEFPTVTGTLPEIVSGDGCVGSIDVRGMAVGVFFKRLLMVIVGTVAAGLAPLLVGLVITTVTAFAPFVWGGMAVAAIFASGKLVDVWLKCEDKIMSGITDRIRPKLAMLLRDEFKKHQHEIQDGMKESVLKGMLDELFKRCKAALGKLEADLNKRAEDLVASVKKSEAEKILEAENAKKVRTEQIEPARAEIAAFAEDLKPYFEQ